MQRAVFLDRDNTLIANDGDLGDPADVRLLEGVAPGLRALHEAGFRLIVVTNQAGVARGRFGEDDVDAVHQRIAALVDEHADASELIDRFYYCPYHPDAAIKDYRRDHPWRKPQPGMLLQAAHDLDLDLAASWMIGDQQRDVAAGRAAGCRTIMLSTSATEIEEASPTLAAATFDEAVRAVLGASANGATPPARRAAPPAPAPKPAPDADGLRRAVIELTEELRAVRLRGAEFTALRLAAGLVQLFTLLLALMGLLHLASPDAYLRWMVGAVLAQLLTIAILLLDAKG